MESRIAKTRDDASGLSALTEKKARLAAGPGDSCSSLESKLHSEHGWRALLGKLIRAFSKLGAFGTK